MATISYDLTVSKKTGITARNKTGMGYDVPVPHADIIHSAVFITCVPRFGSELPHPRTAGQLVALTLFPSYRMRDVVDRVAGRAASDCETKCTFSCEPASAVVAILAF